MLKHAVVIALSLIVCSAKADDFNVALNNVRTKCSNISDDLADLKKMAGINTAITGVGTAAATGATVVSLAKSSVDDDLEKILAKVDNNGSTENNPNTEDVERVYNEYIAQYTTIGVAQTALEQKSKTLGNWRTGLLGGSTATNVVGAIISGNNKVDNDLSARIDECMKSVASLKNSIGQARIDGIDVTKANQIVADCEKWKDADLSVINNRAKGAMISSIVGATTGAAGTVTSAIDNSDDVQNGNDQKEKNLNTAATVLAGGTAVASGVATIFNATQISAVKKIINIAETCENTLK